MEFLQKSLSFFTTKITRNYSTDGQYNHIFFVSFSSLTKKPSFNRDKCLPSSVLKMNRNKKARKKNNAKSLHTTMKYSLISHTSRAGAEE